MAQQRPDARRIIEQILASPRMERSRAFSERVYADEPILQRGSQMGGWLPERCRAMRALASSPEGRAMGDAELFYHQARLMEDYVDDVAYKGTFEHYFPTYQAMSDRQLRGYFTWRARVRAGQVGRTSLSFAFVYLYELLCGIGVEPGEVGFRAIERFWWEYRAIDPKIDRYVRRWLQDYAAYHDLPRALLEPYVDVAFDGALVALRDALAGWDAAQGEADGPSPGRGRRRGATEGGADNPLEVPMLAALDTLSSYRPRVSRLHRDRPDTLGHVCCATLVRLSQHYDAHRSCGLMESAFGTPVSLPHRMFASAVFWEERPHADATYRIDEANCYTCAGGTWYWEGYHGSRGRSPLVGSVLRACDQRLRDAIGYAHPLEEKQVPKYLARIIDREVAARLAWERERESRRVTIDLSKLGGIRAAAEVTREALLTDEEREEEPAPEQDGTAADPCTPPACADPFPQVGQAALDLDDDRRGPGTMRDQAAVPPQDPGTPAAPAIAATGGPDTAGGPRATPGDPPLGLGAEELALLGRLLGEGDGSGDDIVSGNDVTMLVDAINEKLFDVLGDTAIEFDEAGVPHLIEDYVQDVRGAIRP